MFRFLVVLLVSVAALVALVAVAIALANRQGAALSDPAGNVETAVASSEELAGARDLADLLEPIRKEHKLPALAAAAVVEGRTTMLGAVGVRRANETELVTVHDKFHIGSCTKSMTATLCALLIDEGRLDWESTIGEVFSDQAGTILPAYHDVTLRQLLTHRSGIQDSGGMSQLWRTIWDLEGPLLQQRREFIELVLAEPPASPPGEKFSYSNYGYTLAGAMCERATGQSWEALLREYLFEPLEMTTAGFGPPGQARDSNGDETQVTQPWGHQVLLGMWKPMPPGRKADNPQVIGPAGTVHCSLGDWAKYAAFHLRGARGDESRLPKETFELLHTPLPGDEHRYAYGWMATERPWGDGKVLNHAGSNTMWMAVIWLAPNRNLAYLAATNAATAKAHPACDQAIGKLIELTEESLAGRKQETRAEW